MFRIAMRFMFLLCVACSLMGISYVFICMGIGDTSEASKACCITIVMLMAALFFHEDLSAYNRGHLR